MAENSLLKYLKQYLLFNKMQVGTKVTVFRGCQQTNKVESLVIIQNTCKQQNNQSESQCIKILDQSKLKQENKHPNLVQIYDVIKSGIMLYFIQMYCSDGNLQDYLTLRKDKPLSDHESIQFNMLSKDKKNQIKLISFIIIQNHQRSYYTKEQLKHLIHIMQHFFNMHLQKDSILQILFHFQVI